MTDLAWVLPVLIAGPIVAAALALVAGRWRPIGRPIALLTTVALSAIGLALAVRVQAIGRIQHELGGFPRPIGIELAVDELSVWFVVLIGVVATATLVYGHRVGPDRPAFYSVLLLHVGGLLGMTVTADLFNLFVFLEITSIATYALIATRQTPPAALAALKYLIVGTVGSTLYLIGVGYLFAATGTLNMTDMAAALAGGGSTAAGAPLYESTLVMAAFAFMVVGFATKMAIFPLHSWQPDAYSEADDTVSMIVAALVATIVSYAMIRVFFSVYTISFFEAVPVARWTLVGLGLGSIVIGSVLAVLQDRLKRMLAYSSVAQFGLVLAAIGAAAGPGGSRYALAGAVVHLLGHAVVKGGLFAGIGAVGVGEASRRMAAYVELGRRRPILSVAIAVLGLTLVGVPPTVGFVGKWLIAIGALETGHWLVTGGVVATTLLTLAYVVRILERVYFHAAPQGTPVATDGGLTRVPATMTAVVVLAAILGVALGAAGGSLYEFLAPYLVEVLPR